MTGQLLQFGGSLLAILLLAWLVHRLGLGTAKPLADEAEARVVAAQVEDGFEAEAAMLDRDGQAALLRDRQGRIMALRRHGAHYAGRVLTSVASARREGDTLVIHTGEKRFGAIHLNLQGDAQQSRSWADVIDRL